MLYVYRTLLFAFVSVHGINAQQPVSPNVTVLTHATVIDCTGTPAQTGMTIIVTGNAITSIAKDREMSIPANARIVDASGKFLIPGLWDMHVHLAVTKSAALPALVANGVTGVRDVGGLLSDLDNFRSRIEAGSLVGPRIIRSGPMLNGREFNVHQIAVTNASEARGAVRALQKSGVDFIKVHRAISREAYFAALDEARKSRLPLVGHIPRTVTPLEASNAGQACIEHIGTLFEGTFHTNLKDQSFRAGIDEFLSTSAGELFAQFASNKTAFTPTIVSQRMVSQFGRGKTNELDRYTARSARKMAEDILARDKGQLTSEFYENAQAQFEASFPIVKRMHDAGVLILLGTDLATAGTYPGFDVHFELELMVQAGLTPMQALQTATRNCAEFLKVDAGIIASGRRADMVLLEANPLEDIRNTQKIHAVILSGRLLENSALAELHRESERLAATE